MNQSLFNRLLAVASLAMFAAAKSQRIVNVDEHMLIGMNANGHKFSMGRDETLTLHFMDENVEW